MILFPRAGLVVSPYTRLYFYLYLLNEYMVYCMQNLSSFKDVLQKQVTTQHEDGRKILVVNSCSFSKIHNIIFLLYLFFKGKIKEKLIVMRTRPTYYCCLEKDLRRFIDNKEYILIVSEIGGKHQKGVNNYDKQLTTVSCFSCL